MKYLVLLIASSLYLKSYSQLAFASRTSANSMNRNSRIIREEKIKKKFGYSYNKEKNNNDSTLIQAEYFDSTGKLIEQDEYKGNKEVIKIINYFYDDSILRKEVIISKNPLFNGNGFTITKEVKTYTYDGTKKTVLERTIVYTGDSLKNQSTHLVKKEYDSSGYLQKEYEILPNGESYLFREHIYVNDILLEVKTYNLYQQLLYSNLYEYDDKLNKKTVYKLTDAKNLAYEYFYNDQKQLIREKDYNWGHVRLDHITYTFTYNTNGLIEGETFQNLKGGYIYYKYYYSK